MVMMTTMSTMTMINNNNGDGDDDDNNDNDGDDDKDHIDLILLMDSALSLVVALSWKEAFCRFLILRYFKCLKCNF